MKMSEYDVITEWFMFLIFPRVDINHFEYFKKDEENAALIYQIFIAMRPQ